MGQARALVWMALLATTLVTPATLRAEFYTWKDASGQPRVSNIPPRGVRADGCIEARVNPDSIAAQRAALRDRRKARDGQLAAARAALQSRAAPDTDSTRSK